MDEKVWEEMSGRLKEYKIQKKDVPMTDVYTNAFIDGLKP